MKLLDFEVGIDQPFFLIAGPCVIESEALALETAAYLKKVTEDLGINFIYKSSYDKANRTSTSSFRGLGIEEGLRAGMWTVGVSCSGNEVGLDYNAWQALSNDEQQEYRQNAEQRLFNVGAHYVIDSVADLAAVIVDVNRRLTKGERP